jgi:O-antigen/teichoic acid export membrane protein
MGIVRRQSLKHSFVNLVGLGIGGLSVFFLYPYVRAEYGLMQILLQVGMIGLPLFSLGANTIVFRFFHRFKDKEEGHHGFLPLLLGMVLCGSLVFWSIAALFWNQFAPWLKLNSPQLGAHLWMALPLSFFYVVSVVLSLYSANFSRIVVPSLLLDFSQKLVLPILLGSVLFGWISIDTALYGLLLHAALVTLSLVFYLRHLGEWHWKWPKWAFIDPALRQEMVRFLLFGTFGGFALQMAAKSDILLVGTNATLENTGIYAIVAYLAAIIDVPTKSLYGASIALVTKHLNDDNRLELGILYQKVSINLLVAGLLIFGAMWVSVEYIFQLIPQGEAMRAGQYVLFFIGVSRLVEMGTGLNNYLVYYSKYYVYSLISVGTMAILNVALSLYLIPRMGITGAAIATLCSIIGYNAVTVGMVWRLFRLQPFTSKTLLVLALACTAFWLASLLPMMHVPLLDLGLHTGAYVLLLGLAVYYFNISPDLNGALGFIRFRKKN